MGGILLGAMWCFLLVASTDKWLAVFHLIGQGGTQVMSVEVFMPAVG